MNLNLVDKHILIAGGLGGIGQKTVEILLEEGARVSIFSQSLKKNNLFNVGSNKLKIISTDYGNREKLRSDLNKILKNNILDGLITMIGTGRSDIIPFSEPEETNRLWNINYFYPRQIAEIFVEELNKNLQKNNKEIFITFCSSIAAKSFLGAPTEYSVAKSALERLTKELSWKLAPCYRVNCISPGNIYFPGGTWDKIKREGNLDIDKMLEEKVPIKRFGNPREIASFAVYLSSSEVSSFFNGSCITIDGGQTQSL